ncbi:MAG TPA: hypothetical protein VH637_23615 [Streptosporangiaceae bacterium]
MKTRLLTAGVVALSLAAAPAAASASTQAGAAYPRPAAGLATATVPLNCAQHPSACGYPDGTNTGLPPELVLKRVPEQVSSGPGWKFDSRGWVTVSGNGAVLSGLYIPWNVNVTASDVTIKDDRITHPVTGLENPKYDDIAITLRHTSNVTVEHDLITGLNPGEHRLASGVKDVFGDSTGIKVLHNNIFNCATSVQLESGLVSDNYIHDTGFHTGDHVNGVTSNGGKTGLLTVQHNTILVDRDQTDAVGLFEDFGIQANRVITNNLLAGGGYAVYGGEKAGGPVTNHIVISHNRFSRIFFPNGGRYGPVAYFNPAGTGNSWTGNFWDDTGQVIPSP